MTPEEVRAAGALAGSAVAGVAASAQRTHRAVSAAVARRLGPTRPLAVHDAVTGTVYDAIRVAAPVLGAAAGHSLATRVAAGSAPLHASPRGNRLQAVLNGAAGSTLAATGNALAVRMSLRHGDSDVEPEANALRVAYPDARPRLVVLLHGWIHDENAWNPPGPASADPEGTDLPYGRRLELDAGVSAVHVRYNTGKSLRDNAEELDGLLSAVAAGWPVPLEDLVLVGHSMGGLVARTALHLADAQPGGWRSRTSLVVTLGSPYTGAPLAAFADVTARALDMHEVTRGVAAILHRRSDGLKDLHRGTGPLAASPDEVRCVAIGSTVTRWPRHPAGWILGDLLVRPESAVAGHAEDSAVLLGGIHHNGQLHHDEVYAALLPLVRDG